jgi:hypothetical protein
MKINALAITTGLILAFTLGYAAANPTPPAIPQKDVFSVLATTKISLDDAIHTAEQTVAGTLIRASLNTVRSPTIYKIAIADSNTHTITDIKVDPVSGRVVSSKTYHTDKTAEKAYFKPGATKN